MRKINQLLCFAATVTILGGATPAFAKAGDKIEGSYICVFKEGAVGKDKVREQAGKAAGNGVKHVYANAIRGFSASAPGLTAQLLRGKNPNIAYCEQDQEVEAIQSSDPFEFRVLGKPPAPQPSGQTTPWGITRVGGGVGVETKVANARAFVIDTGIDLTHPDLNTTSNLHANFVARETSPSDLHGHGTHVAGTIAAKANTIGVIGVVPGAQVVAVRVLDRRGSGTNSGVIAGVEYVASVGRAGDVANMSLGGGVSQALDDAVRGAASVVKFALAAGNESESAMNHSPARAGGVSNTDNVYTIASFAQGASATDLVDPWSSFSNYGKPPVSFAEPGSSILSTYKGGGYATMSGTSMATPHFAGILLAGSNAIDGQAADGRGGSYDIGVVKAPIRK
ncbi:S8 family serine peptidase [Sphingomonas sp. NSE70-1]|uniref:S8 family serine peptidase n=1 Tax=Sphingomonas caseinilyticus TaxID=2908205 RepID=A0ABT0RW91_9SPHN|nr:S8 family serine peptidase [Sphingomonas caseinilyticus]MCL6699297.1 S8 family serine peptidase [Sphingomonas caseinilyticus]